jgi:hypothetical protein
LRGEFRDEEDFDDMLAQIAVKDKFAAHNINILAKRKEEVKVVVDE